MGLFGPKKITLTLEKYDYRPGETIKGNVTLKLKKPTVARKLEVTFIGERIERHRDRDAHGHSHTHTVHVPIYDFKIQLDGEKEYFEGTYPFEIKIPLDMSNFLPKSKEENLKQFADEVHKVYNPDGKLSKFIIATKNAEYAITGNPSWPVEWSVKTQLDIPMRFDIGVNQKISLS